MAEKELGLQSENWRKSFLAGQAAGNNTFEHYEAVWKPDMRHTANMSQLGKVICEWLTGPTDIEVGS